MAQDFWASSGYALLERAAGGLRVTDAWIARFLAREELAPPLDAGAAEKALHAKVLGEPRASVGESEVDAVEDEDARENWRQFLRFRERLLRFQTIEQAYVDLFRRPVDIAPLFVDALAQVIVRHVLDGTDDPWLCRAGEMFFRRQRVSTEGGQALAVDATTVEMYVETGGFGNVGRLLRRQNTQMPEVKMDVLGHENAAFYFLRDELYGFALDLTPGRQGTQSLARVLEGWVRHLAGVDVSIEPLARVQDERWRWHVGLDVDASAILDALYRGEPLEAADLDRVIALFRLEFGDPAAAREDLAGLPVYLGLACRPDRTLKMKPQNLLVNLPLRGAQ